MLAYGPADRRVLRTEAVDTCIVTGGGPGELRPGHAAAYVYSGEIATINIIRGCSGEDVRRIADRDGEIAGIGAPVIGKTVLDVFVSHAA